MAEEQTPSAPPGALGAPSAGRISRLTRLRWMGRWILVLVAVVGSAIAIVHWGVTGDISEEDIARFVDRFGVAAPLTYLALFATLGSFFIPTTVFVVIGVMLFGKLGGFLYSVVGGFLALMVGFSAARTLGREAVSRWLGKSSGKLLKLDHALERRGITTSMFVRLLYLPNGVINATFGVSAIRYSHYAIGSLLGHIPIAFAVAFMTEGVKQAVLHSNWHALLGPEVIVGVLVFLICVSIPFSVSLWRRRVGSPPLVGPPPEGYRSGVGGNQTDGSPLQENDQKGANDG